MNKVTLKLIQSDTVINDIFSFTIRYSGRTEKQAVRDAQMKLRQPPSFSRRPSRRFSRRNLPNNETTEIPKLQQFHSQEIKHISLPTPVDNFETNYGTSLSNKKFDSPRSTRSAPWSQPHSKGLYNNNSAPASPRSVRSGSRYRSSSVDSQSSNDSRGCKRRKHRSRTSDNESELSKSSSRLVKILFWHCFTILNLMSGRIPDYILFVIFDRYHCLQPIKFIEIMVS